MHRGSDRLIRNEPVTVAAGRATATTRSTSAGGVPGSSGTATRPAVTIATSAVANSSGSGCRPRSARGQPGLVEAALPVLGGGAQACVGERAAAAGLGQVDGVAVAAGRLPI